MAGRGPAPKPSDQRRGRNALLRGEWIDLPKLDKPILPALPRRSAREGAWSARTRAVWAAWRQDSATTQYGPSEVAAAVELAFLFESYVRDGSTAAAREIRQRMDGLGLTPKGKRDLRWRVVPAEPLAEVVSIQSSARARLRAVDPTGT